MRVLIALALLSGCLERLELRGQQCAQIAIAQHGFRPPLGVYGTWTYGMQCWSRLWTGERVYEGPLNKHWRPE